MVRWWSGTAWSDVTTPAGPGVVVQRSPVLAPPRAPEVFASDPEPASPRRPRSPWLVPLLVLALVVVVVAGVLISRSGATPAADAPPPSVPSFPSFPGGPSMAPPSFAPGTVRIIDSAAGISYPYLGEGWSEWAFGPQVETTQMAGQYFTTQEVTPDGTTFIAQCTSGPLLDAFGYAGPSTLKATMARVADSVRG